LSERTSYDIDKERSQCDLDVLAAESNRDKVEAEIINRRREIDNLRIALRDLDTALLKSKCVVRELKAKKAELDRAFWSARHSGL
jgi:hypothetical protein